MFKLLHREESPYCVLLSCRLLRKKATFSFSLLSKVRYFPHLWIKNLRHPVAFLYNMRQEHLLGYVSEDNLKEFFNTPEAKWGETYPEKGEKAISEGKVIRCISVNERAHKMNEQARQTLSNTLLRIRNRIHMTDKWKNGERIRMNIPSVIRLIGAVFFLAILPVPGHALTPGQVFDKVKDAVVVVKTLDARGKVKGQGSGVLISSGRVATNCHVIEGGASYQVGRGKQLVSATLYAEDGDKDICLLDAKGIEGKPAQLGKAAGLKVGDPVYAVGAPKGLELSLSDGIVAQLRGGPPPLIQTTAAISPGSSGGGLFDGEGRLVGLTTLYLEGGQSLNFAMPVEWIGEVKPGRKPAAEGHSQTEWGKRAFALENLKDWQRFLDWCRKWTKSEPEDTCAWYTLGVAYDKLNRYNDAIEAYRQALRINPEDADAWYNLGLAYGNLNRYNDAIEAFRQALRINPEYSQCLVQPRDRLRQPQALQRCHRGLPPGPADQSGACQCLVHPRDRLRPFRQPDSRPGCRPGTATPRSGTGR